MVSNRAVRYICKTALTLGVFGLMIAFHDWLPLLLIFFIWPDKGEEE